jgi:hypothetical protein
MRARSWSISGAGALALAALGACSKPAPPSSAAGPAPANEAALEELPELTPVPAPDNLVGLATLRTPARTLDTALAWTRLGLDFRALLQSGPIGALLPVLDLEAPIDAAMTLDPQAKTRPRVFYAASIGLTSRQGALDALTGLELPIEPVEPGIHSVRPSPKSICFVAPALGQAKARLVCGQDRESVELLTPYLTRGAPSASTGDADLHLELRADAAWRLYGEKAQLLQLVVPMLLGEVSLGDPAFDGALRDGATALVDELIATLGELSRLTLDARLRVEPSSPESNELEAQLTADMRGGSSWVSRTLAGAEGHASVAPDSFWKLPADATQAAYYASHDPQAFAPAGDLLTRLLESGLAHFGASRSVQRAWPAAFRAALDVGGPMVSARSGIPKQMLPEKLDAREELRAAFGYTVFGVEDPERRTAALLEQTLELYKDVPLRKSLTQKYGLDVTKLPKVQSKKGPARLAEARTYELALPAALFAEALAGKGIDPSKLAPIPIVIVTCREGQMSWFGVSSYGAVAEQTLSALVLGTGSSTSLASRTGLERLRRDRGNAAGFWTLAGLASGPRVGDSELAALLAPLADNRVPIVGRLLGRAAGPSGTFELHVPAQLFRDVAFAAAARQ